MWTNVVYVITLHHGPTFYDTTQGSGMLLYCCTNINKSHAKNEHLNEHLYHSLYRISKFFFQNQIVFLYSINNESSEIYIFDMFSMYLIYICTTPFSYVLLDYNIFPDGCKVGMCFYFIISNYILLWYCHVDTSQYAVPSWNMFYMAKNNIWACGVIFIHVLTDHMKCTIRKIISKLGILFCTHVHIFSNANK